MLAAQPTAKLFVADSSLVASDYIGIFHRWIQQSRIDQLLIDVHNYSHVPGGPGIILIAHESYHCIDQKGGREGLWYRVRRGTPEDPSQALAGALKRALDACQLLQEDSGGKVTFSGASVRLSFEDRLRAPNDDATFEALEPQLQALASSWFGAGAAIAREPDPRANFAVTMAADSGGAQATQTLQQLAARVDNTAR